jgi:dTDP-4-amino-4,6-dideoxygalactose transaminase
MEVPFSRPSIGPEEHDAVNAVLDSGWLSLGPKAKEFEEALCKYTGARYAVVMDSCTSALTISLRALQRLGHTQVTTTPLTYVATANTIELTGLEVKFSDIDEFGNLDAEAVPISDVIMPVHYAGFTCDIDKLATKGLVLEDAAHALSATYDGKTRVGNHPNSAGACFSFYATKPCTTGEGGAFVTSNDLLAEGAKVLSLHGLGGDLLHRFERSSLDQPIITELWGPGYKGYMSDIAATMGITQLMKLDGFTAKRRKLAHRYIDELWSVVDCVRSDDGNSSWHMFVIHVQDRDNFVLRMKKKGIGVGIHYSPPLHLHPYYRKTYGYSEGDFPKAEYFAAHCVGLPLYPNMTEQEQDKVIKVLRESI